MSKVQLTKLIFSMAAALAASSVFALPFGVSGAQPVNPQNKATPMTALSPDQFDAQVTQKNKQAQQDFLKQAQSNLQQLKSQLSFSQSPSPRLKNQPTNNPAPLPMADNPMATPTQPTSPAVNSSAPATAGETTPAEPTQDQPYTGFGSGSTTQQPKSAAPSSQSSGGWSIKY